MADGSKGETDATAPEDDRTGREVVVPVELYKVVTVFSTLIAVVFVVLGFTMFDAATSQVSALRRAVEWALGRAGLAPDPGLLSLSFAALGVALVLAGAGVYVVGARFRTEGMGKPKDDPDRDSGNG